ncbi:hypothetical protein ACFQ6V_10670 [Streptomyces roseifaciens]
MIITTDPSVARLAAAWERIHPTSPADEAVPLVLDCARRLAADPGGEEARIWVSGLVAMSGYLAWRPEEEAERAALDALRAAVEALGGRTCSHDGHPYEAEMDSLEDEPLDGWVCPAFLRDLAEDTLLELASGLRAFESADAGAPAT